MARTSSFDVKNADDFFTQLVIPQYEEFLANNASSRHALLTTILAYHLYEWVHGEKFTEVSFLNRYPFHKEVMANFEEARNITNGTKHFKIKATATKTQGGFSSGFSDGFARPLVIICSDGSTISADNFLRNIVNFWEEQKTKGAF